MVEIKFKNILTMGILEGFAGKTSIQKIDRAGFGFKSSDWLGPAGHYHDEWIAGSATGAGQEVGEIPDGKRITRLYAGGIIPEEELAKLGLKESDILGKDGKLVFFINQLGDKTRLDSNIELMDGRWSYRYKVLKSRPEIPIDISEEEIRYDGQMVFVHYLITCPVK